MQKLNWRVEVPSTDQLRKALERLTPETSPRWGKMNSSEMLFHVAGFGALYFGEYRIDIMTRVLGYWLGPLFLRSLTRKNPIGETPKNLKTLPSIDVRKLLPTAGWVELQRSVFKLLDRLDALDSQTIEHPIYGKVHTEDFSALIRHHTAHHFHQFGLI